MTKGRLTRFIPTPQRSSLRPQQAEAIGSNYQLLAPISATIKVANGFQFLPTVTVSAFSALPRRCHSSRSATESDGSEGNVTERVIGKILVDKPASRRFDSHALAPSTSRRSDLY